MASIFDKPEVFNADKAKGSAGTSTSSSAAKPTNSASIFDTPSNFDSKSNQYKNAYNNLKASTPWKALGISQDEYDQIVKEYNWSKKYEGQSYTNLRLAMGKMNPNDEEYQWLDKFASSAMTEADYDKLISQKEKAVAPIKAQKGQDYMSNYEYETPENSKINFGGQVSNYEAEIEKLKAERWMLQNAQKYGAYSDNPDFKAQSAVVDDTREDNLYRYINNLDEKFDADLTPDAKSYEKYDYMTEDEKATYNYIYNVEGRKAAENYLNYLGYSLDEQRMQDVAGTASKAAAENPFASSLYSTPANLMSGAGFLNVAGQKLVKDLKEASTGEYAGPINYNNQMMDNAMTSSAIRQTVAQKLAENGTIKLKEDAHPLLHKILDGKSWGDVYQLGMSMVDSAAVAALTPVLGSAGTYLLGGSAATQSMLEALERGASDGQAISIGLLSGAAETLFEKIGMDNLVENIFRGNTAGLVRALASQGLSEGLEEVGTSITNTIVDYLVMAEKFGFSQLVAKYKEEDPAITDKEAIKQALADIAISLGWDFVGGLVTGGIMGAGGYGLASAQYAQDRLDFTKSIYGSQSSDIIKDTLEMNPKDKFSQKMQTKVDTGKELSGAQVSKLLKQNKKAIISKDIETIKEAASSRLTELGETENVDLVANALAKQAAGKFLTGVDRLLISNAKYGKQVSEELAPETDRSKDSAAGWTSKISTRSVNAAEYNKGVVNNPHIIKSTYSVSDDGKTIDTNTGEEVTIKGIDSLKKGEMTLKLSNGAVVPADEVAYSSNGEAVIYETIASLDTMPTIANELIKAYNPDGKISPEVFARGTHEAFTYGKFNIPVEELMAEGSFATDITDYQRHLAYKSGQKFSGTAIARQQAEVRKGKTAIKVSKVANQTHINDFNPSAFKSDIQRASYNAAKAMGEALGVDIYLFESYIKDGVRVFLNENGEEVIAPNGYYQNGTIHLDINAGFTGKGTMLFTLSHELTHFISEWSPAKFKVLANFLNEQYGKKGISVDTLVRQQMEKARAEGRKLTYDEAYEEFVADSMETMLTDGKVAEKLAQLKHTDESLWAKIKEFFTNLYAKVKELYSGLNPDSKEGKYVSEMVEALDQIQTLFAEGLAEASANYQAAEQIGVDVDSDTESVAPAVLMSERTWTESDYVQQREDAANEIAKAIGVTVGKAKAYIDSVNSIAKMIAEDRTRLDYFSSPGRSSFVSNVEYGGSFDFSTLCKKRRLLTGTFTAIQKALPNTALTANEILEIRNKMKEKGLEVSCGLCYVEGSRANMGQFAKEFLKLYKKYYPDAWQPNMADVNTPDGIEWVRINHPECYEQYEYFWNHYGTLKAEDKNLFASQQKPKLYQLHTEYKGEILDKFKNDDNVEEKNLNGGIRLQSFSDFEIVHLIDTMQIIMDMSRVGLAGQAYTKVPDFAWALGDTGLKINLSLIAKGVDADGKLIFDDVEGMPINDAMALRDRYSANVGTILVAFNDEQLYAAMADDRVDFIIPFHRSQWKKSQYEAMGLPAKTKDYTFMQNEKYIKPQYHEYRGRMVKDKATNYMPNEYWDFSKSGKENAEAYLEMCARNNKRPKFYKLLQNNGDGSYSLKADGSTDGYWKLLIDFKMYDNNGVGSPQAAVKPEFNMEEATRMLNDYRGGHSNFPVTQGIVDEFVSEYKKNHPDSQQSDVKYSGRGSSKPYRLESQLQNWANMHPQDTFVVGATPKIWQSIGLANLPVTINQVHINYAINGTRDADHHLGYDMVKQLPQAIKNPMAIIRSDSRSNDSVVVILKLEHTLPNGSKKTVIAPVNVNGIGKQNNIVIDSNTISSYFGKGNILEKLRDAINDEISGKKSVYWINKKEAYNAMSMSGLQLPGSLTRSGLINSIRDNDTSVNQKLSSVTESKQFKAWFGKSAVVDDSGKPLVVYHGSSNKEIRTFKTDNAMGTGGLYFTTDESVAKTFAGKNGKVYPSYVRLEHPYVIDADYVMYDAIPAELVPESLRKKFPDWKTFDTNAIVAWARENGKYDGVWIKNVREAGMSVYADDIVIFNPNQSKSVYNVGTFGSTDNMYYQTRGNANLEKVNAVLEKQNEKLREDVKELKSLLKLQKSVTNGTKLTPSSVESVSKKLMRDIKSKGEVTELKSLLTEFYETLRNEDISLETARELAQPAVDWLHKNMVSEETLNDSTAFAYEADLIEQDIFSQVLSSYWDVSTLHTVADVKQQQINKLKAKHNERVSEMRKSFKAEINELKKSHEAETERIRTQAKQDYLEREKEIIRKYQESRKNSIEGRAKTAEKAKIRKKISQINKLLNRGTKERNVKEDLQDLASKALTTADILFTENYSDNDMIRNGVGIQLTEDEKKYMAEAKSILERMAKLPINSPERAELEGKLTYRKGKLREVLYRERARIYDAEVTEALEALADAYKKIPTSEYAYIAEAYDPVAADVLDAITEELQGRKIRDMSLKNLERVNEAYTLVLTTIRNANKSFAQGKDISEMGDAVVKEIRNISNDKKLLNTKIDNIRKFGWNNLKPVYAFKAIGSDTLSGLFDGIRAGEDTWARDVFDAKAFFREQANKTGYDSWDLSQGFTFTSTSGLDFTLTLEQIMSLYAFSKREQALDHLQKGGIVFDQNTEVEKKGKLGIKQTFRPNDATAYNISADLLTEIVSKLNPKQIAFVDAMQDYLSTTMGAKGNEVSMALYGIKLFKEKNYFPLKSASQYQEKAKQSDKDNGRKLKNSGFTKATKPKAGNPIVLSSFMDVWSNHVNDMSMYHAFVLPMEDFYKVYNYKTPAVESFAIESVNAALQNAYTSASVKYIDQLLEDLAGGARRDSRESLSANMLSKFKKASTFASLSVVIQQPSAIGRAFAYIDPKYFVGSRVDSKKHSAMWEEVKKYAPVAMIKEMGYFDMNMGHSTQDFIQAKEYKGFKDKVKGLVTDETYRDDKLSRLPALADEMTWGMIWEAVKRETLATRKDLAYGSEAFLEAVGKRFTEVIVNTQVYDSVLSRSAMMRSKGLGASMLTSFMAEPTTTMNMVLDGILQGKRGNMKVTKKAIGAAVTSVILNAALVSIVYAMRDDDEDETFVEKYLSSFAVEAVDGLNPLTYFPVVKDIWSLLQGYDIERSDMALISDLIDSITKTVRVLTQHDEDMTEEEQAEWLKSLYEALWGNVDYISALYGIPEKNIRRDIKAAFNFFRTVVADTKRDTTALSLNHAISAAMRSSIPIVGQLNGKSKKDKLYEALTKDDTEYANRIISTYSDADAANSAVRGVLRKEDSRIRAAAVARIDGDIEEYKRLAREIVNEGHFDQDTVVLAINAEITALSKKEDTEKKDKAIGFYKSDDFADVIASGNTALIPEIKQDIVDTYIANGKTAKEAEESFISNVTSSLKDKFLEGGLTKTQAINALVKYCGKAQDAAEVTFEKWQFRKKHGFEYTEREDKYLEGEITEAELKQMIIEMEGKDPKEADLAIEVYDWHGEGLDYATEASVKAYNEHCASLGISKLVYLEIRRFANQTDNDIGENGKPISYSAMKKIMAYINQYNISAEEKTAIAESLGWSAKNIKKYKLW